MLKKVLSILFLVLFILSDTFMYGQLVTTPGASPASLVQNVLLGNGVTVSNITYNGVSAAISEFTANGTNLGINHGIVLTTGTTYNTGEGPQGPNDKPDAGINNGYGGYSLLQNLVGGTSTYNAAVLEFDFIPYSDTVRFKYVFGSDEYPEFVGSQFNDVFAFFISGPGISGNQNMAKLPNGQVVAINNVNNGYLSTPPSNSAYYVENGDGSQSPYNSSTNYIQYDGFTKVLEAFSRVQCGQKYHLIIAIADVGDGIYDSGIFLEANSLTSKKPVDVSYELSQHAYPDTTWMAEGCTSGTVTLKRSTDLNTLLTIPITLSGTATQGADYTSIPSSVTFQPGQTTAQFSFDALQDNLPEGNETLILTFLITDPCGNVNPIVINLQIADVAPVAVTVDDKTMMCEGDDVTLTAVASGGGAPYSYLWNDGSTSSTLTVSPTVTTVYSVTVTDACLNESATDDGSVIVPIFEPVSLQVSEDITEICPYVPHTLEVTASGGNGVYFYKWLDENGQVLGTNSTLVVTPSQTSTYYIVVHDQCGKVDTASVLYTITSPPLVITMSPDIEICPGDSAYISVSATGGYGQYYYYWPSLDLHTSSAWVYPDLTTTYAVEVSDECQTFVVNGDVTVTVIKPTADFAISSHTLFNDLPVTFQNLSQNAVSYYWTFGDGNSSVLVNPNNTYDDPGTYYITLIATDQKGCKDTVVKPISIEEEHYLYVPNSFTPDDEGRYNGVFQVSTVGIKYLHIEIFDRWGELIFESKDLNFGWDGKYHGNRCQDGTYTWKIDYEANSGFGETLTGHVNLLK